MKFNKISEKQFRKDGVDCICSYDEIKLPRRGSTESAGYDIYAIEDIELFPGDIIKVPTGINVQLDSDKVLIVVPRSGLGFKYKTHLWNTVGVIDADYINSDNEGHIWVKIENESNEICKIKKGTGLCQGIIMQYFTVEDDDADGIRNGGFGSTTK